MLMLVLQATTAKEMRMKLETVRMKNNKKSYTRKSNAIDSKNGSNGLKEKAHIRRIRQINQIIPLRKQKHGRLNRKRRKPADK